MKQESVLNSPCCLIEGQLYKVGIHGKVFVRRDIDGWCLTDRFTAQEIIDKSKSREFAAPLDQAN